MSRSWGHEVRFIPQETINFWKDCDKKEAINIAKGQWNSNLRCSAKCSGQKEYYLRYHYITGSKGRASWAEKAVCLDHAIKFAFKNNINIPTNEILK